jgi:hypothetical protein
MYATKDARIIRVLRNTFTMENARLLIRLFTVVLQTLNSHMVSLIVMVSLGSSRFPNVSANAIERSMTNPMDREPLHHPDNSSLVVAFARKSLFDGYDVYFFLGVSNLNV